VNAGRIVMLVVGLCVLLLTHLWLLGLILIGCSFIGLDGDVPSNSLYEEDHDR